MIRRSVIATLSLAFLAAPAWGWWQSVPQNAIVGGAAYTGPGDVVSGATAWYGLRAYSAAVAATGTQNAINIRRASDNATSDILILTTGALDVATAATFCASTTCFVTKAYDQSGNSKDASQATAGNQPALTLSCLNTTLPCITFTGSSPNWLVSPVVTQAVPYSIALVASFTANFTTFQSTFGTGGNPFLGHFTSANQWVFGGSSNLLLGSVTDSVAHSVQATAASGATTLSADGTGTSNANTRENFTAVAVSIGGRLSGNNQTGVGAEWGLWPGVFSSVPAMEANQKAYWGTP